jgi:hypothetical protein
MTLPGPLVRFATAPLAHPSPNKERVYELL